jgi:hypothetical protein
MDSWWRGGVWKCGRGRRGVKYRARLGVRAEFQARVWGINEKDLASTCKKLCPSDHLVS